MVGSWQELGARLATARKAAGFTQEDLATAIGVDRTAVTKIEAGIRAVDSLELVRIAEALRRPVSWFVTTPPPSVVSRRAERGEVERAADVVLETLAQDVEQLVEMGLLCPREDRRPGPRVDSVGSAEASAREARRRMDRSDGPLIDLVAAAEALGLYAFVLDLEQNVEGSYVALSRGGVALIQGRDPIGRRRFTLAHELGHHFLADAYSTEWVKGGQSERERLVSAFAIHFLLPRDSVQARWTALVGSQDARNAAIFIAAEFGVSWSATCAHLRNLDLITEDERGALERVPPRQVDFMERELRITDEPRSPSVPRGFAAAVVRGCRTRRLGAQRAVELLRGTLGADELPPGHDVPLEAMLGDLAPL